MVNKKAYLLGIGAAIFSLVAAGFAFSTTFGVFALIYLEYVAEISPFIAGGIFAIAYIFITLAINRLLSLFSNNVDYRKGLTRGLLLAFIPIGLMFFLTYWIASMSGQEKLSKAATDESQCAEVRDKDLRASCYSRIAKVKNNEAICGQIQGDEPSVMAAKSLCYKDFSYRSTNPARCQEFNEKYEMSIDKCIAQIAEKTQRPELCHGVVSEKNRPGCYLVALWHKNDPLLIKRFCPFTTLDPLNSKECIRLYGPDSVIKNQEFEDEVVHAQENFKKTFIELSY
jgi:hypothetical protein